MSRELRGIKGKDAIKAFLRAGGIERPGKGDHVNIKMPNGMIITVPGKGELKIGLLISAIHKADLNEEEFFDLLCKTNNPNDLKVLNQTNKFIP